MGSRLAGTVAALGSVACLVVPAASAAQSPLTLRASILTAGRTQHSVHYVSSSVTPQATVSIDGHVGLSEGVQRITFREAGKVGHVTVVVAAQAAYIRGDAFTLHKYLGFKAAASTRYGNHWIVVAKTHKLYAPVSAAVTLASAIDQLLPTAGGKKLTSVGVKTVSGTRVIGVRAASFLQSGVTQLDTLYARASGTPLPVEEIATQGTSFRFTLTFDRWNEKVHVAVPTNPVPIAKVLAAGGPAA